MREIGILHKLAQKKKKKGYRSSDEEVCMSENKQILSEFQALNNEMGAKVDVFETSRRAVAKIKEEGRGF